MYWFAFLFFALAGEPNKMNHSSRVGYAGLPDSIFGSFYPEV